MMIWPIDRLMISACVLTMLLCSADAAAQEQRDGSFGFSDLKVFRLGSAGGPWHVTDLDGDGDTDLTVWVGEKGELIQFFRDPDATGFTHRDGGNTLVDPDGWRRETISVRANVDAINSGDLDGDGQLDLILSCPNANRIEIRWGSANTDRFKSEQRIRLREIARGDNTIDVDLDGENAVLRILSKEGIHEVSGIRRSGAPVIETLPGTSAGPISLVRGDLDGDGIDDLLTVSGASSDRAFPLRLRPGTSAGWGPEILFESEDSRFLGLAPMHQGQWLLLGDRDRPILRGMKVARGRSTQLLPNPEIYPLSADGIGKGSMAVGDLDGDGDPDLVITDAEKSLLRPFWNDGGKLTPGRPSPTLKKPTAVLIHNQEVIVTSSEEGGAGKSVREDSGFSFPALLDDVETENLIAVASSVAGGPILSLHKLEKRTFELRYHDLRMTLESSREPSALHLFDKGSKRPIVVVEIPFETPRFYHLGEEKFESIRTPATVESGGSVQAGPGGTLLVARDGRCRIISVDSLEASVERQIDAPGGSARVVAAMPGRFDEQSTASIVLIDAGQGMIHLSDGTEVFSSVEGPFKKVRIGQAVDLDADGIDEILMIDDRSLMVVRPGTQEWRLTEVFSRRHSEEDGRATAFWPADLNADGESDLVVIDGVRGELEILAGEADNFRPALRFQVFEKKVFRGGGRGIEPRAVIASDLDGDGSVDAAILVHDRLIIYLQNSAEKLR
ncbi:MAG: VCBS repeat-containing protein [Planctomycetota bacterium]